MSASFSQIALFSSLLAFGLSALVLPMTRHRLQHGQGTGFMLAHLHDPVGKVVGVAMTCQNSAVTVYAILHLVLAPEKLSVWPVSPLWAQVLGLCLILLALVITVTAQAQMGRSWRMCVDENRTELVTSGLFSISRNPIYSGSNILLVGMVLLSPSPWTVCLGIMGYLLVSLQTRLEEGHLITLHGPAYRAYAARVGRFLPGVGRIGEAA